MNFLARLAANRFLDVGAVVVLVVTVAGLGRALPVEMRRIDFAHYYASSRLALDGRNPYRVPLAAVFPEYRFVYDPSIPYATNPPTLIWLFAAVAWLPVAGAYWCWMATQVASLWAILWLVRRLLGARLTRRGWLFVCVGAVTFPPVINNFMYGQVQLALAALVLAAFYWRQRGWHQAACAAITVAGLIKLYPLVLLPWFLARRSGGLRLVMKRAAVGGGLAVAVLMATNLGWWRDFLTVSTGVFRDWMLTDDNIQSLPPLAVKCAGMGWGNAVALVTIGAAYAWCWRVGRNEEAEFSLLTVAMLAGGWLTWSHYFVFLIFPLSLVVLAVAGQPSLLRLGWLVLLWVLFANFNGSLVRAVQAATGLWLPLHATPLAAALSVGVFFWRRVGVPATGEG